MRCAVDRIIHGTWRTTPLVGIPAAATACATVVIGTRGRGTRNRSESMPWSTGASPESSEVIATAVTLGSTVVASVVKALSRWSAARFGKRRSPTRSARRPSSTSRTTRRAGGVVTGAGAQCGIADLSV